MYVSLYFIDETLSSSCFISFLIRQNPSSVWNISRTGFSSLLLTTCSRSSARERHPIRWHARYLVPIGSLLRFFSFNSFFRDFVIRPLSLLLSLFSVHVTVYLFDVSFYMIRIFPKQLVFDSSHSLHITLSFEIWTVLQCSLLVCFFTQSPLIASSDPLREEFDTFLYLFHYQAMSTICSKVVFGSFSSLNRT